MHRHDSHVARIIIANLHFALNMTAEDGLIAATAAAPRTLAGRDSE